MRRALLLRACLGAAALSALTTVGSRAAAQCAASPACPPCGSCRVPAAPGQNPSTSELADLFDRVAEGPDAYGSLGWDFGSARARSLPTGLASCGGSGTDTTPARFPCVLLKAIYVTESNWRQFCTSGSTVIAFDCGYGIAQVTSGMRPGETSTYDAQRVAAEPAYNVSVGAAILADKWRTGPCVGDRDPDVVEDWYFATWGYNGFAFKNNPNNPSYASDRVAYRTPGVAAAQVRGNYPYQEIVWGFAAHPPSSDHYVGVPLVLPQRSEICASCPRPTANVTRPAGAHENDCAAPSPDAGTDAARDAADDAVADAPSDTGALEDGAIADARSEAPSEASPGEGGGLPPSIVIGGDEGCACRTTAPRRDGSAAWIALGAALLLRRRGRG